MRAERGHDYFGGRALAPDHHLRRPVHRLPLRPDGSEAVPGGDDAAHRLEEGVHHAGRSHFGHRSCPGSCCQLSAFAVLVLFFE